MIYAAAMTLLVTGAAGFVGSRLALRLEREGHDVTVVDRSSNTQNLRDFRGRVLHADISDASFWNALDLEAGCIFHEAACTDTTVMDEAFMNRHNVAAFLTLLQWAEKKRADVIYASSAAVYGAAPSPQRVGTAEQPLNAYGRSKLMMDKEVRRRIKTSPIKIIGLRYFNVYGPGEGHKQHMASMIYRLAVQMRRGERPRIFTDGEQRRDQIYVDDVVAANILAMNAPKERSGIYNVGTGKPVSFNQIIRELNAVLGTDLVPSYFENPYSFYQDHTEADIGETTKALGFSPQFDLRSGIRAYEESGMLG